MLKLRAIEGGKSIYYDATCQYCGHTFIYRSTSPLFKLLWDKSVFDLDFAVHQSDCTNAKLISTFR